MFKKFALSILTAGFFGINLFAQTPAVPMVNAPPDLPTIISESSKQAENYRQAFKNLLATETKTYTKFDKNGESKNPGTVESDFLVYQSSKDANSIAELRNVTKVDGKPIPDAEKRSEAFFAELQKTSTLRKELEKLESENSKYDKTLEISGVTLSEAVALTEKLQPFFDFKLLGTENYQGADVYVVSFLQTRKSPDILLNSKNSASDDGLNFDFDLPGSLKKNDAFLRGKLWIDAKTFRVRREQRELFVQPENPVVLLTTDLEYQPSDYDLLVPKKIVLTTNSVKKKGKNYTTVKDIEAAFDYSKFRKTETDVKILDDDEK